MVTQKETTTPLLRKKKAKLDFSRTVTREKKNGGFILLTGTNTEIPQ
jgi:hypothetical protein